MAVWINDMGILDSIAWTALFLGSWWAWRKNRKRNKKALEDFPAPLKIKLNTA